MLFQTIKRRNTRTLELGLYDAVAHFNIGAVTVLRIFQALNIPPGKYTEEGCKLLDQLQVDIKARQAPKREEKS